MDIISRIRKYLKTHSLRRIWYRVALVLSSMAVFVTTYFLMLPALTITGATDITRLGSITGYSNIAENGKGLIYNENDNLKIQVNNIYRIDAYLGSEAWCGGAHKGNIYNYLKDSSNVNTVLVRLKSTKVGTNGFNGGNLGSFLFADTHNHKNNTSYGTNNNLLRMKDSILYQYYLNGAVGTRVGAASGQEGNIDFSKWVVIRVECYKVRQERYTSSGATYEFYAVEQVYGTVDRPSGKRYSTSDSSNPDAFARDMIAKLSLANSTDKGFMLLVRKDFLSNDSTKNGRASGIYSRIKDQKMYIPVAGLYGSTGSTYDAATPDKDYGYNQYQYGLDTLVDFNQEPFVQNVNIAGNTWTTANNGHLGIYSTPQGNNGSNGYRGPSEYSSDQHGLGFITFSTAKDQRNKSNAGAQDGDIETIDNIDFKLFNYSWWINSTVEENRVTNSGGVGNIRKIAPFFNFRYTDELVYDEGTNNYNPHAFYWNDIGACACMAGNGTSGTCYLGTGTNTTGKKSYLHRAWPLEKDTSVFKPFDSDSFEVTHTTVEYNLLNGYPVLDFTRDAKFKNITHTIPSTYQGLFYPDDSVLGQKASENYGFNDAERSLAYLFSKGDSEVKDYYPTNTILQYDKNTGKYYYDSSKNAVDYDDVAKIFRLRGYVESGESGAFSGTQTFDFFPFNFCSGIVTGTEYAKDSSGKYTLRQKHYNDCQLMASLGSGVKENYSITNFRYNNIDYWFGMTMEFNFTQNKDGKLVIKNENGEVVSTKDMIFNFAGDDDVWVFIDDVLALDLGGTHSIVNGSINFATGEIIQSYPADKDKVYNTTLIDYFERAGKVTKPDDGSAPDGWKKVTDGNGNTSYIFEDYSIHNLKFFYLERGGHVANNKIEFYMSTFPNNSLLVEKQVTPKDDPDLETIKETQEYKFRVLYTDSNGVLQTDGNGNYISLFNENDPFIIRDYAEDGTELDLEGFVGEDGIFTLKDGQTAIFNNMNEFIQDENSAASFYVVQELLPDGQVFQYDGVAVNDENIDANTTISGDDTVYSTPSLTTADTNHVRFTNKINKAKLHNLEIIKNLEPYKDNYGSSENYGENINADTEFPMEIIFNGDESLPVGAEYYVYDLDSDGKEITDSKVVKNVELISEEIAGVTTNRAVIKIKNGQKAVIKGVLEDTTFGVREIFDAGAGGYTVTYTTETSNNFDGTCTVDANGVNGQMSSEDSSAATVTITVKNSRKGTNVIINVKKIFKNAEKFSGAPNLTFAVYMVQLEQPIPTAERTDSLSTHWDFSYSVPVDDDTKANYGNIYYPDIYQPNETVYYYYRIYESRPEDRPKWLVDYDTSSYIMTVKVEKSADGSELTATIESMRKYATKNSEEYEELSIKDEVVFTNTLKLYSLPTTGANLFLNTRAFSLLGTAMVVSLLVVVLVCVRKRKTGVF